MNPFKPNLTQTRSFETFKPNSSRVDKLENQIVNLKERVATLEKIYIFLWDIMKKVTIKEITIEGEKIVIDFDGAPFWKYYVLQLYFLICHRKRLINYIDEASLNL